MRAGIYLVYPGMGKTPAAQTIPGLLDWDFGHLRKAAELSDSDPQHLVQTYARTAEIYRDEGWAVLCNEPAIMNWVTVDRMYIPKYAKYSVAKLAKTRGVTPALVNLWICDWAEVARHHNVPITEISCGFDEYLKFTEEYRE